MSRREYNEFKFDFILFLDTNIKDVRLANKAIEKFNKVDPRVFSNIDIRDFRKIARYLNIKGV